MYSIVGCNQCEALWIVADRPSTTGCPRCGTTHQFDQLRTFVETDDIDAAQRARGIMLAQRQHGPDAVENYDKLLDLEPSGGPVGFSDASDLAAGTNPDAVEPAESVSTPAGRNRRDIILTALRDLDHPTPDSVEEYAADHGISSEYVHEALDKLRRAGKVSKDGRTYRLR